MAQSLISRVLFIPNKDFPDEFSGSEEGQTLFVEAAEHVKGIAEESAPVLTGAYKSAFVIVKDDDIVLGNTDFKAHLLEWGTSTQPALAILRRAVTTAGYRLSETSK